jgi:hypothetical protein
MRALVNWLSTENLKDMEWGWQRRALVPYSLLRDHLAYLAYRNRAPRAVDLASLCVLLGPYRNLTTLLAGIVMLHPSCQVLNHAATRILPIAPMNFLIDYSDEKFDNFVRCVLAMSYGGRRGDFGGSILHSHAFDDQNLRQMYLNRFGSSPKHEIKCLLWKDSMRLQNYIQRNNIDLDRLSSNNGRIRFLLPIRNPIDCAISNAKTGHARFLVGDKERDLTRILDAILRSIAWFLRHRDSNPEHFYCIVENNVTLQFFDELATFLGIEREERWLNEAIVACQPRHQYIEYDTGLKEFYLQGVERHLSGWPWIVEQLSDMVNAR